MVALEASEVSIKLNFFKDIQGIILGAAIQMLKAWNAEKVVATCSEKK